MNVSDTRPNGHTSLTGFVEARSEQSKDFAREYRQLALNTVDFVSETLRSNPERKHEASNAIDDLRNSLHALKEMTLQGRQTHLDEARQAIDDSRQSGVVKTEHRSHTLEGPHTDTFPTAQSYTIGTTTYTPTVYHQGSKLEAVNLHKGAESAVLDANEPSSETTRDAFRSGEKTMPVADKATPLIQTVLAHPAFGKEEAVDLQDNITASSSGEQVTGTRGFFHHTTSTEGSQASARSETAVVTPVPMMEEALGQLQVLRDLISSMRPMPSSTVAIQIGRPISETATLSTKEWPWSDPKMSETPPLVWGEWRNQITSLLEPRDVINVPCVPAYVSMK